MAPLLFILALVPLYQRLQQEGAHRGVVLHTQAAQVELRVAGYADDTAVYLRDPGELKPALLILDYFSGASGLILNLQKTVAIALHPDGLSVVSAWSSDIRLLDEKDKCLYLGFQAGSRPSVPYSWEVAGVQLRTRIRLSGHRTLTVDQRARVAAAVIIPKLLYVGRHAWPTTAIVKTYSKCIKNFVWTGLFTEVDPGADPWIDEDVVSLPRREGGMAVPDLRAELLAMAATMISEWAVGGSLLDHLIGDILHDDRGTSPAPPVVITPGLGGWIFGGFRSAQTMRKAGVGLIRAAGAYPLPSDLHDTVMDLYTLVSAILPPVFDWSDGQCLLNILPLAGAEAGALRSALRRTTGAPCLEWLLTSEVGCLFQWAAPLALGLEPLDAKTVAPGRLVQDVVRWELLRTGRLVLHKHPDVDGDLVRTLVIHLLAYFPELVFTPTSPDELRLQASPGDHPMVVHVVTGSAASLERTISISVTVGGPVLDMAVASRLAAITTLNEYGGTEAHIHSIQPHPRLNRLVCLWKKKRKWTKPRHEYKSAVGSAIIGRGRTKVADRAAQWAQDQGQIAKTIAQVSWNDIRRITGATGWGEQIFYRLKLRAFKWWDVHRRVPGCPVEECLQTSNTSAHRFWHCPSAVSLWTVFYSPWVALGMEISEQRIHATLGLKLVYVPVGIWEFLDELHRQDTEETRDKVRGQVHQLLQWCWALGVVTTMQAIWRRRCLYRENLEDTSAHAAAAILHGRLRSAYLTIRSYATAPSTPQHRVAAAKLCYLALTSRAEHDSYIPRPISSAERRLLFFDGGSRGNPGPGGAGAVIITMGGGTPSPVILWMASVSYATRTTNNVAEYQGLLVGLRYAARHQLYGLNVEGDSQLILTQLRKRRIPRSRHLQGRYEQCRMLADRLMVTSWTHHLRHFNKMADRLANITMDLKKSIEITAADIPRLPPRWAPVAQALQGDVGH